MKYIIEYLSNYICKCSNNNAVHVCMYYYNMTSTCRKIMIILKIYYVSSSIALALINTSTTHLINNSSYTWETSEVSDYQLMFDNLPALLSSGCVASNTNTNCSFLALLVSCKFATIHNWNSVTRSSAD